MKLVALHSRRMGLRCFCACRRRSGAAIAPRPDRRPSFRRPRESSRLSEQTRDRIAAEVAALKASGKASPEVVAAYEAYLARVQEMVAEHQKLAAQIEAAYSAHRARSQAAVAGTPAMPGAPRHPGPGEDPADRLKPWTANSTNHWPLSTRCF
ncbi:MAG: hypothetical protein MZV70_49015 [Desulfobacterales bacterium]|nr:hypothetical protein [Desulfobacterales bacterium]